MWTKMHLEEVDALSNRVFGHPVGIALDGACFGNCLLGPTGEVWGFVIGQSLFDEAELYYIAIDPKQREKGYGKQLLDGFIKACRQRGAATIFLEVRESNEVVIAFYEKAGFQKSGVRKHYYKEGENAVLMRRGGTNT